MQALVRLVGPLKAGSRHLGTALALAALAAPAWAISGVDLSQYQLTATYALPVPDAMEASAVTYNWNTNTLFVLGDEGDALVEVSLTGQQLSSMTLTEFDDTEALTYLGNGSFVLGEERLQDVYLLQYAAGQTAARSSLPFASLGPTVGNVGIEGISFDPRNGQYVAVKEKTPQRVVDAIVDFNTSSAIVNDLFVPNLGTTDLSDVQVLATVPSLIGTPDEENLLIYSQESAKLLEVTRSGTVLSSFDFAGIADNAEGVTIDSNGVIYIVGENPSLYVLTPIPEPAAALLLCLGGLLLRRR